MRRTTLFAILLLAPTLRADLPAIRLTSLFPPGARAGTTVDVTLTGVDLDDLSDLRFSHPGIFARPAVDAAGAPQPNRFLVAVGPAVPPGVYDGRAVGRFGISTPVAFAVGDLPELNETATNASPGGATEIPVGSVVNGVAAPSAVDHFRFAGKAGQRVMIDYAAREIDSRLEPVVVLTDAAGREIDRTRRGSPIDFTPPAEGVYLVQVHDHTYRGGPSYFYRLSVSARPHIDFVLPPAGVPGTRGRYVLYGRNLPGGAPAEGVAVDGKPLQQLPVEIELPATGAAVPCLAPILPSHAAVRGFPYRLRSEHGMSNPALVAFTDTPPTAEPADNDQPEQPATLPAPFHVAGRFYPQRDRDWYGFEAKKGEAWWVEVLSHRLGVASDPFLLVQRVTKKDKGEMQSADVQEVYDTDANAGGADFNTATRDPVFRIEAKEDGSYRVQVRDLFNTTRDDPRLGYVLSVRKEKPDFHLLAAPVRTTAKEAPAAPLLRKGGAVPLRVIALRRDGFNGEIKLSADGLPPGVTCAGATIAAGSTAASLVFVAGDSAANWAGSIRVVGTADVGGAPVTREASGATIVVNAGEPPAEAMHSRLTRDVVLAVAGGGDSSPLFIELAEAKTFEAPVGGKLPVPLKLTWRADAAGKVKLKAGGHPALDNAPDSEIDAKAATATVELDLSRNKLPPGTHTLYVRAEAKVKYTRNPEAARAAAEAKQAAEKAAADATAAAKAAAEKLAAAKAGPDAEATKAAEKAAADADAASKQAEQRVKEATARAVELGPKDADAVVYSTPVLVRVVPAK